MEKKYHPQIIEAKWQERWEQEKAFAGIDQVEGKKYYCLEMFPYPSGRIHMGQIVGNVIDVQLLGNHSRCRCP